MPPFTRPWFSRSCWSRAINPRKMLPAPKWTQVGAASVASHISFQSNSGSFTPAADQAALSRRPS